MSTTPRTDAESLTGLWEAILGLQAQLAAKEQELAEARETMAKQLLQLKEIAALFEQVKQVSEQQLTARDATIEGLREALALIFRWWDMNDGHLVTAYHPHVGKRMEEIRARLAQLPPLPSAVPVANANPSFDDCEIVRRHTKDRGSNVTTHWQEVARDLFAELTAANAANKALKETLQLVGKESNELRAERDKLKAIQYTVNGTPSPKTASAIHAMAALAAAEHARHRLKRADAARQSTGEQGT